MPKRTPPAPSATLDGTQAFYYPTEIELWTAGPPINDPAGADPTPGAPPPASPRGEADFIHAAIHEGEHAGYGIMGETYGEEWVNVRNYGPTGIGRPNDQPFQTSRTVHVQGPQSDEQGWGLDPGRQWARFPVQELPNPDRNSHVHLRNGELDRNVEDVQFFWAQERELGWQGVMRAGLHGAVVEIPASVPYVETVNPYGTPSGGPTPIEGIDVPVYW